MTKDPILEGKPHKCCYAHFFQVIYVLVHTITIATYVLVHTIMLLFYLVPLTTTSIALDHFSF